MLKQAEENIEHIDNQLNKKRTFKLTSHHLLLGCLLIVTIIAIAGIALPTQNSGKSTFPYDTVTTYDVQGMINESLNPINKRLDDIKQKVDNINAKDIPGGDVSDFDAAEISFIDIYEGSGVVSKGKTYKLIAKKGDKKSRKNLSSGGGKFIVKLPDNTEHPLPSNDNGITASLYVKPGWTSFTIIYRYDEKDLANRTVSVKTSN